MLLSHLYCFLHCLHFTKFSMSPSQQFVQFWLLLVHFQICCAAKLLAELPVSCIFPLVFGAVVYPFTGLNSKPAR
jgi:hypothetical protein